VSTPDAVPTPERKRFDLCCVGSPLIDYVSSASLDVVARLGLEAGAMTLVDGRTAARVRAAVGPGHVVAGGTVANTAAGVASLGGAPVFVGAVATDDLGATYESDLASFGVRSVLEHLAPLDDIGGTGACYVIATPDHHRTMATHLGVSGLLHAESIGESTIGDARLVYFDGYLLDFPDSTAIVERIVGLARAAGTQVALGLADPFVVERHGARLRELVRDVDIVFSNEDEAKALTGAEVLDDALARLERPGRLAIVTCGADGARLVSDEGVITIEAAPVETIVDVTGAGDLFAAGVIFGLTHGLGLEETGSLGALCAGEAITHLGARPATSLRTLAVSAGLVEGALVDESE
jgi:adenosine kinase